MMARTSGPGGCAVWHEPSHDTPLVWLSILTCTGSAADPFGYEGFYRHAFELARRGTANRPRARLDDEIDRLGASLDAFVARDYNGFTGMCLSANLDALTELIADVLTAPAFDAGEHDKLVRESLGVLDERRDDDADVAMRFFTYGVAPGYPYSRTSLGTVASLAALDPRACAAAYQSAVAPNNLVIGLAGDIDAGQARAVAERLTTGRPPGPPTRLPELSPPAGQGLRIIVVDKPRRTQSQIVMGHVGPAYGTDDYAALRPVETAFGGVFTSRLMQEVRVKRGWSYGATCHLGQARGPYWLRLSLAPSIEQTAPALELVVRLYRDLRAGGVRGDELAFATKYLAGQTAFQLATAHRRLSIAMEPDLLGSPPGYVTTMPARLAAMSEDTVWEATQRWIRPDQLCIVVVSTAADVVPAIEGLGLGPVDVVAYDSY